MSDLLAGTALETQALIMHYYQHPVNNSQPSNYTCSYTQGNQTCGDNITVYIDIDTKSQKIKNRHFYGNTSLITTAAASYTAELIVGQTIDDILTRDLTTMHTHDFQVSPRRKRAAVIALLATRNAIYQRQNKEQIDTFADLC